MRITPRMQLWAASIGSVAALRLPSFSRQLFDPDEASIASQAITLQHSGRLYVDTIDRKPPVPAEIYRLSFDWFGTNLIPLHVLVAAMLAVGAAAVASDLLLRHDIRTAWWGLALYVTGALAFLPDSAQAANYAQFALLPGTLAVLWARRPTWRWAALAGMALGVAVLCRQTWAIGIIPGAVALWWPRRDRGGVARACVYVATTGLTVGVGALLVGPFGFWHWVFTSNEGFVTSLGSASLVIPSLLGSVGIVVGLHGVLLVLLLVRLRRPGLRADLGLEPDLWLWMLTGLAAAFTGFRFFGHYFLQTLPAPVLLAAPVAAVLWSRVSWRRLLGGALVITTAVALAFAFAPRSLRSLPDPTALAAYVRAHTSPEQSIFVWGNFPEVYWRSDRPTAGAFVSSDFVVGLSGNRTPGMSTLADSTPGAASTMVSTLMLRPPELIVDTSTAGVRQYQHYPMSVLPQLGDWVASHYEHVATVGGVWIYRLR